MTCVIEEARSAAEWDAFVESHPGGTADHLYAWRTIFERVLGHQTAYLVARQDGRVVGVLPLVLVRSRVFGRSAIAVPFLNYGGMLADDAAVRTSLLEAATQRARAFGASHVELRHVDRQFEELPFRQHKLGMRRDLPTTTEALWSAVDRKIRNQVRKAQKEGLEAVTGGAELVDEFYRVFAENMRDLGTPVYPSALFSETLRLFSDRAKISVVRYKGRAVAAGVVMTFRDVVLNPWASSLREFRHLCPNMLLYWTFLEQAVRDGARVFDFGRSSPGGGTHQFKLQWGAVEVPLHWEYVLLNRAEPPNQGPSNPRFERAIRAWQRLPLPVANVLGPRIARHLP
ncbi:MAG: FemAB family XrtA/PEP-CTERM system-associated protein [Acidobacteriota bacterium]